MNRSKRAAIAQETLDILNAGIYQTAGGLRVDIGPPLADSMARTRLYRPADFPDQLLDDAGAAPSGAIIEVTEETTLQAAARLATEVAAPDPFCLNFASAKNPGGGFLSGSQAQEESLARSSGLYPTQTRMIEMYEHNRRLNTCLYSDHMIYSPVVPVFRDDDGRLLERPYAVSFLTAPAVNAGAVTRNEPCNVATIRSTMQRRLERILWVARQHHHAALILGAWGCGVFDNDPTMVAELFQGALGPGGAFANDFARIVFAVFDRTPGQPALKAFQRVFA